HGADGAWRYAGRQRDRHLFRRDVLACRFGSLACSGNIAREQVSVPGDWTGQLSDSNQRKLLELLDAKHPAELRLAALTVLEHLGSLAGNNGKVVLEALDDTDPDFRLRAIRAVGRLGIEGALPVLLARIRQGGPESEAAAGAAAQLGPRAARAL